MPKQLSYVSKKTQSPVVATVLVGIIITPISLFCSLDFITSIVSFGALLGFILLNIAVISRFLLQNNEPISLRRKIINYGICPVIGLAVTVWIFVNLDANAHLIGAIWLLIGCLYLAGVTKFFRNPVPQLELG
ncbi:hypothetical protein [Clostridium sp.]|uniref:hypothetical protein n=1 Tax=Clostridium sp. TaxID=1506 RepID=UPI00284B316A|nr:hypothetical protein [Clostridium sp.]MDR3593896.1 hypothetical protein [Clostridium sp.]